METLQHYDDMDHEGDTTLSSSVAWDKQLFSLISNTLIIIDD